MLKDKFKDLELTRRHLADIIKDNNISLKLTHIRYEGLGFSLENPKPTLNINEKIFYLKNQLKDFVKT